MTFSFTLHFIPFTFLISLSPLSFHFRYFLSVEMATVILFSVHNNMSLVYYTLLASFYVYGGLLSF